MDIKSLASSIKAGENKSQAVTTNNLGTILDSLKDHSQYTTTGCVYIDGELHQVLKHIKMNSGVSISSLVSFLIESFIEEHKQDILLLLDSQTNRFLK